MDFGAEAPFWILAAPKSIMRAIVMFFTTERDRDYLKSLLIDNLHKKKTKSNFLEGFEYF
jgi:hypothetical protein